MTVPRIVAHAQWLKIAKDPFLRPANFSPETSFSLSLAVDVTKARRRGQCARWFIVPLLCCLGPLVPLARTAAPLARLVGSPGRFTPNSAQNGALFFEPCRGREPQAQRCRIRSSNN